MADPFKSLTRHHTYYIPSADLYFLLGHVQFRVHRYFFERESAFFRGKLTVPMSPGSTRQGSSDGDPLVLENVRPEDFERFLWVFYNPRYSLYDAKVDDWSIILSLSHRWGFAEVKALAVRELEKKEFSSIDRIVFYQANDVDRNLLIPHFAKICARESPLTLEEGMKLGMETTLVIASAREYIRAIPRKDGGRTPTSPTVDGEDLYDMIRELFNIPRVRKTDGTAAKDDAKSATSSGGLPVKTEPKTMRPQAPPLPPTPPQSQHEAPPRPRSPPPPPLPQKRLPVPEAPTVPPKMEEPKPSSAAAPTKEPLTVSTVMPAPPVEASLTESTDTPSTPKTAAAQRKALRREKQRLQKLKEKEATSTAAPNPQSLTPADEVLTPASNLEGAASEKVNGAAVEEKEVEKEGEGKNEEVKVEEPVTVEETKVEEPVKVEEYKLEEPVKVDETVEEAKTIDEEPPKVEVRPPTPVPEEPVEKSEEAAKSDEPAQVEEKEVEEPVNDEIKSEEKPQEEAVKPSEEVVKPTEEVVQLNEEPTVEDEVKVDGEAKAQDEVTVEGDANTEGAEDALEAAEKDEKDNMKDNTSAAQPAQEPSSHNPSYARSESGSVEENFKTPTLGRSRASSFGPWSDAEDWADADDGAKVLEPATSKPVVAEQLAQDSTADVEAIEAPKTPKAANAELEPPAAEDEAITPVAEQPASDVPEPDKTEAEGAGSVKPEEDVEPEANTEEGVKAVESVLESTSEKTNGDAQVAEDANRTEPAPLEETKANDAPKDESTVEAIAAEPSNPDAAPELPKAEPVPQPKAAGADDAEKQSAPASSSQAVEDDQADAADDKDLSSKARKALKKKAAKNAKKTAAAAEPVEAENGAEQPSPKAKEEEEKGQEEEKEKENKKKKKKKKGKGKNEEEARNAQEEDNQAEEQRKAEEEKLAEEKKQVEEEERQKAEEEEKRKVEEEEKRKVEEEEKRKAEEERRKAEEVEDNQPLINLGPLTPASKRPVTPVRNSSQGSTTTSPIVKKTAVWGNPNSQPPSPVVMPQRVPLNARLAGSAGSTKPRQDPTAPTNRGQTKKDDQSSKGGFGSFVKGWL